MKPADKSILLFFFVVVANLKFMYQLKDSTQYSNNTS